MSKKSCVTLLTHAILIEFLTKASSSVSSLSYWNKSNSNLPHLAEKNCIGDCYWGEYTILTKVFRMIFLSIGHRVTYSSNLDETLASFKMSNSYQKKFV